MKAINVKTDQVCAIKLIANAYDTIYSARQVYREIKILRKLSEFQNSMFVPKLYDIILPGCSNNKSTKNEEKKDSTPKT